MMKIKQMGAPMIHNFPGDIRDFTPDLFQSLAKYQDLEIALEQGYGHRLGFTEADYKKANPRVRFVPKEEAYNQELVVILKCPDYDHLELLRDGTHFFSMIHYPTRPKHVEILTRKNIIAYSMDTMVDDSGIRMFVDYFGTAFAGCEVAFKELEKIRPDFYSKERNELRMSIVGSGGVGQACVKSAEILSDHAFLESEVPGLVAQMITRSILNQPEIMKRILSTTDILVDASKRPDSTKCLVSNDLLGYLPETAVILDLSADRYDQRNESLMVKAFEGIPTGSPEQNVIGVDDRLYEEIPPTIPTTNRRLTVSSNAWPAVKPLPSIQYYEKLLRNYLGLILDSGKDEISIDSDNIFERALYRGTLKNYLEEREEESL